MGLVHCMVEIFEFEVRINGISTEDELQDTFLEFVEENNN